MTHNQSIRMRLRVHGRVQGVGFRWFVSAEARRLGLAGWVRNQPDGTVELEAEGTPASLEVLRLRVRTGPPAARVDRIEELPHSSAPLSQPFGSR